MSTRIEDSRGGFFVAALIDTGDGWELANDPEDPGIEWAVVVGDFGCHITIVDGTYSSYNDAHHAATVVANAIPHDPTDTENTDA